MNEVNRSLKDFVPSTWFKQNNGSSIWIRGYRCCRIAKNEMRHPKIMDFNFVRAILIFGKIKYLEYDREMVNINSDDKLSINPSAVHLKESSEAPYLLLMRPFDIDGTKGNEKALMDDLNFVAALLAVFNGRNMIYKLLFDNEMDMEKGTLSCFSQTYENPQTFKVPDITDKRLETIVCANKVIYSMPENVRNKVQLSLRWYESALYESGVDAFIKFWVALETLAMDNTYITKLNDYLAKAYEITRAEAKKTFLTGKLFGLRSKIIHEGRVVPIHFEILDLLAALYFDILLTVLNLKCEGHSASIIENSTLKLDQHLSVLCDE